MSEFTDLAPTVTRAPHDLRSWLATNGMGTPGPRAGVFAAVVTFASYTSKYPRFFFTEQGDLKRFAIDPDEDEAYEATQIHFAVVPVLAFGFAYLFL